MGETGLLLKAYYEALYELLGANRESLSARIAELLSQEVEKGGFEDFGEEKYAAYRDACIAFIDERLETYNPIGFQYIFDRSRALEAFELELELNWYDSRAEYVALAEAASEMAEAGLTDDNLRGLAEDLIRRVGAFPDKSIITTYEAAPHLRKLPDYIVARSIEELVASQEDAQ